MIITNKFVYIHMPKTGGTFVEAAVKQLLSSQKTLYIDTALRSGQQQLGVDDKHQTVRQIPSEFRDRPVLFTIRNPYSHYVSFYEFGWWKDHPGDIFDEERIRRRYPHYPEITYSEYLNAVFDWEMLDQGYRNSPLTQRFVNAGIGPLTAQYIDFLFDQPEEVLENLNRFMSEEHCRETADICFIRMEQLNQELFEFLLGIGYDPAQTRFILEMAKVYPPWGKKRQSAEWETYYTPDTKRVIRQREHYLFAMFPGYDD